MTYLKKKKKNTENIVMKLLKNVNLRNCYLYWKSSVFFVILAEGYSLTTFYAK